MKPLQTFLMTHILRRESYVLDIGYNEDRRYLLRKGSLLYEQLERLLGYQKTAEGETIVRIPTWRVLYNNSLQRAYIIVALVPIVLLYPFLQKYFVKGVLIGSIKE